MTRYQSHRSVAASLGFVLFCWMTFCPVAGNSHHGHSMYDYETEVSLEGTLRNFRWANPHVIFELETIREGESTVWVIEAEPPALMSKFGWTPESVSSGDLITVNGIAARNRDRKMAVGISVDTADGTRLWISGRVPYDRMAEDLPNPFQAESLSGNWVTQFNPEVFVQYFHREPSPGLTDKGNDSLVLCHASNVG